MLIYHPNDPSEQESAEDANPLAWCFAAFLFFAGMGAVVAAILLRS